MCTVKEERHGKCLLQGGGGGGGGGYRGHPHVRNEWSNVPRGNDFMQHTGTEKLIRRLEAELLLLLLVEGN